MSVETEFRALLAGFSDLTDLVGTGIALSAAEEGTEYPLVIFSVRHTPEYGLDGTTLADICTIDVQCWAETPSSAAEVADAVMDACETAPAAKCATVVSRADMFDEETAQSGVQLQVEWWA